jgi:hypothetical protein
MVPRDGIKSARNTLIYSMNFPTRTASTINNTIKCLGKTDVEIDQMKPDRLATSG